MVTNASVEPAHVLIDDNYSCRRDNLLDTYTPLAGWLHGPETRLAACSCHNQPLRGCMIQKIGTRHRAHKLITRFGDVRRPRGVQFYADFRGDNSLDTYSGVGLAALAVYHTVVLPTGSVSRRPSGPAEMVATFGEAMRSFFRKPSVWGMLAFIFFYRMGEGFLLVEGPLFMQASIKNGGLGLSLAQKAMLDGTLGTIVTISGGLLGGYVVSKRGLSRTLLLLAVCMNVPHFCYVVLSQLVTPEAPLPLRLVYALVSLEKLGYSVGFIGNMIYMVQQVAPGRFQMAHHAFATALTNLVLVPTQALSGLLADLMGYRGFFVFVLVASIPSVIAAWKAPFPNPRDAN